MGTVSYLMQARVAAEWIGRLHRAHGAQLLQFLTRMLGDRQAAEEIAQETYLKLHRLCRAEDVQCARALLFDAAAKLALSYLRRTRAKGESVQLEQAPELLEECELPERRLAAEQALHWLEQAIEQLPPGLRTVFVLRYLRQMPRQEIAEQLNISVNAVEQRLTRALAQCRARLSALGFDGLTLD